MLAWPWKSWHLFTVKILNKSGQTYRDFCQKAGLDMSKTFPSWPTDQAIQVACMIWRRQGFKFISKGYTESNSEHIQEFLSKPASLGEHLSEITAEDQSLAQALVSRLTEELIVKKLSGSMNEFEQSLLTIVNNETVNYRDAGKLAYLPEMYNRFLNKAQESELFRNSKYLGRPGDRLELSVKLVRKKLFHMDTSKSTFRWTNTVVTSGQFCSALLICQDSDHNMIKIFHRDLELPSDRQIHIRARVKKHDLDQEHGVPSTILNYVKILEINGKV